MQLNGNFITENCNRVNWTQWMNLLADYLQLESIDLKDILEDHAQNEAQKHQNWETPKIWQKTEYGVKMSKIYVVGDLEE